MLQGLVGTTGPNTVGLSGPVGTDPISTLGSHHGKPPAGRECSQLVEFAESLLLSFEDCVPGSAPRIL